MKYADYFALWIMVNYVCAAVFYTFSYDYGRALYWLFAIGIVGASMFLIK